MEPETLQRLKEIDEKLKIQKPIDDERRSEFEEFLEAFPGSHEHWIQYIKEEQKAGNLETVERLFYRCLPIVPSVSLFQFYLNFISQKEGVTPEIIKAAYDYALDKVGLDIKAYPLYADYLDFLDSCGTKLVNATLEYPRDVFHRALLVPLENGQHLHNRYHQFESERAPNVCNSFFKEWDQHFKVTKEAYTKKAPRHQHLTCDFFATGSAAFEQLFYWRFFILFETKNESHSNNDSLIQFVIYAYKKALVPLRYEWIIWHELAQYYLSIGNDDMAISTYAEAIQVLPRNLMLSFAYADLLESRKRAKEALPVYRAIIQNAKTQDDATLAEIELLKFIQRTEGPDAMRREFVIALESNKFTYHLLVSAAEMENAVNLNSEAAKRILKYGIELYGKDPDFIQELVNQYIKLNHIEGLISIYSKVTTLANHRKLLLCNKLLEYFRLAYDKCIGLISHICTLMYSIKGLETELRNAQDTSRQKEILQEFKNCSIELSRNQESILLINKYVETLNEANDEPTDPDETQLPIEIDSDFKSRLEMIVQYIDNDIMNVESFESIKNKANFQFTRLDQLLPPIQMNIQPIDRLSHKIPSIIKQIEDDILTLDRNETRHKLKLNSFFLPDDFR